MIFFLDDDDLLGADVLARIDAAFRRDTEMNCLFVNVETFGRYAEGTRNNQAQALERTLGAMGKRLDEGGGILRLNSEQLFGALLERLPMAFQRVAIRRTQLEKIGFYSGKAFGDLEWNYRVALRSTCGLLVTPGYRVRCEGQSYFSRAEERQRLIDTSIRIREGLLNLEEVVATTRLKRLTTASLANAHFEKAHHAHRHDLPFPWRSLFRSTVSGLQWRHFSVAAKALGKRIRQIASGGGNSSNRGRAS